MKKIAAVFLAIAITFLCAACSSSELPEETIAAEPQVSQMRSICELAVMECYYHNVAKFTEENAESFLWWSKDKRFWIEYSGIVKVGIDVSLVDVEVNDSQVTITIPRAEVQSCKVDSSSLTKDSYIVDKNSADIKAEDETLAFKEAQLRLEENASKDSALLTEAQQRAQALLEDYVTNIGNAAGKEYSIHWVYTDKNGETIGTSSAEPATVTEGSSSQEETDGEL